MKSAECGKRQAPRMYARLALLAFALASGTGCSTAPALRESGTHYVRDAVMPYVERGWLPGAISVLQRDGVQETDCIGYADVAKRRPIRMDDPFMQCSQTKGFCGVTVAILVEEGRLGLDDPVSKYLPEFGTLWVQTCDEGDTRTLRKAANTLTVRMVMNHTGGFPFEIPCKQDGIPGGGWSGGAPLRSAAAIAAAQPLLFEPGTKERYSNTGFDIGAAIVETVTGRKWEEFLQERVLDPLGMRDTTFRPTDAQLARKIEMYDCHAEAPCSWKAFDGWQQPPYGDGHVFPSAGAGLWTTANDQLKFYRMLMNLGVGDNGVRILKEETVRDLLATSTRPKGIWAYSLGFAVNESGNGWFGHGGAWGTQCSVNWKTKELKLWVVQLTGQPRPWDKARDEAVEKFFAWKPDDPASAYTGRIN